jgi:iron complex transport system ATP-binding protein
MLRVKDLTINIGKQKIIEQLNLEFKPGEVWGILGPNGVGKTTFLHTLSGLRAADNGEVLLNEIDVKKFNPKQRAQKIGLLAQDTEFSFPATVFETALIGRYPYSKKWFGEMRDDFELTNKALTAVQLNNFADRLVTTLSGGERRRLALATVLTQDPDIYLLDEPTNHLDLQQKIRALSLLKQLTLSQHKTIIMVLHDIHLLRNFCDKVIVMQFDGKCNYGDCTQMLSFEQLGQVFPVEVLRLLLV